jgi:fatty aldehyde decarbonylase
MQTLTYSTQKKLDYSEVITDIISQAITGELIGMANFASLAGAVDDIHERMESVEHANCERNHAEAFMAIAKKFGLQPKVNPDGHYWKTVRECFLKYADKKDFIGCLVIQEVMLECFAVSMYRDIGKALNNEIGQLFRNISKEEEEHIEHSIELLKAEFQKDQKGFTAKMETLNKDCMTILAEWTAKTDLQGHCGVCKGNCMKDSLPDISLDVTTMRGNAMNLYLRTLERIGLPGDKTLRWVINLPM